METLTQIVKGEPTTNRDKIRDMFTSSDDGLYIFKLERVNPLLTPRDYQKAYFDRINICSRCSSVGYTRAELHEMFKEHAKLETTKGLDILAWTNVLTALRWWAYSNFDCMV